MEKRHRIFTATNLPEDIKRELAKHQDKIKNKFIFAGEEIADYTLAKWTGKDNLHITLEFLGYLTDQEIAQVCSIVKEVALRHEIFYINLKKILFGPKDKPLPKMIWVDGEKSRELAQLKSDLQNSLLESIRFAPETREFSPHITLARLFAWQLRQLNPEDIPEINENIELLFTVESVEIMESVLKRNGPVYEILESCPLKT